MVTPPSRFDFNGLIPSNIESENDGQDDAMEGEQWR
jgi:hypothetical protein